ncbi:hypothetical protein C8Q78DRAFT_1106524, partial [Trametes maxima]
LRHTSLSVCPGQCSVYPPYRRRQGLHTAEERTRAWAESANIVRMRSDEIVRRWNAEIDTLLVYAGLFSAILTAFTVESYRLLQPSSQDPTVMLLREIYDGLHFNATSRGLATVNISSQLDDLELIDTSSICFNTFWFSSLVLSLFSAAVGIMVKQWLNEFSEGLGSAASRHIARTRQYRFNGLVRWRVKDIVTIIPIMLQLALFLFIGGLLIFLQTLNCSVFAVLAILAGLSSVMALVSTLMSLLREDCPFVSPLTIALFYIWQHSNHFVQTLPRTVACALRLCTATKVRSVLQRGHRSLNSMIRSFLAAATDTGPLVVSTWRSREQSTVFQGRHRLEADLLAMAYDATKDPDALATVSAVCLTDLDPSELPRCFWAIHTTNMRHFG